MALRLNSCPDISSICYQLAHLCVGGEETIGFPDPEGLRQTQPQKSAGNSEPAAQLSVIVEGS